MEREILETIEIGHRTNPTMLSLRSNHTVHVHVCIPDVDIRVHWLHWGQPHHRRERPPYPCASSPPYALLLCFGTNLNSSSALPKNISEIFTQSPAYGLENSVSSSLLPLNAGGRSLSLGGIRSRRPIGMYRCWKESASHRNRRVVDTP